MAIVVKKRTDEYTSTLSARYYKDGAEVLIEKTNNSNPRKLTPNEARRLQGFPDWFQVNKSDNEAYKQFGNAVTVPVVQYLADEIINFL
ncbi:MAG: DNA cytosine methyltransferase [Gammaproteobacteria bacterium]